MKDVLKAQYQFTQEARSVLINYCRPVSHDDFICSHPDVGNGGSIRNMLVHINNSYHGWLKRFALKEQFEKPLFSDFNSVADCEQYFQLTNDLMARFIDTFNDRFDQPIQGVIASRDFNVTPLQIFTHVVTHEFHHKGQVLVLGRAWGYEPVDTDVLR